jgi:hypothetical protein
MTKPAKNDIDTRKGDLVIGATLALAGVAVVLDRAGAVQWRDHWTLWPLILGGIGLARFLQSVPGEPKQGLLFLSAAVWLFLGEAGWVSFEESWPIVIIALGVMVALNGGRRRRRGTDRPGGSEGPAHIRRMRRPDHPLSSMATIGIWIAIFVALQVSGFRSFSESSGDDRVRLVSVMGRSDHTSNATAFQGADVTSVMGGARLDLRNATLAPGATGAVHVFALMGRVIVRVPPTWTVDASAVSAFGGMRDDRIPPAEAEATAGQAPRLVLRGLIVLGGLTITS